jgi:hypothetical protein
MKKLSLLLILCSFFAATSVFAQTWSGSSLNGNTYREGRVAIGYPSPGPIPTPQAKLDINLANPAGASEGNDAYIPHIRLQQTLTGSTPIWDITGGLTLNFGYGTNGSSTNSVLSFNNSVLNYNGTPLKVATGENQLNIGAMTSPVGNSGQYFAFGANPNTNFWQFTGNSTNNGGAIIHGDNQGNLFFITRGTAASNTMNPTQTADNVRLFINGSGNVGIGTSTPIAKLHVNNGEVLITNGRFVISDGIENQLELKSDGLIHAREIEVDLDIIPDYVFADDYNLMPLAELQKFIDLNHHLPNIKSAEEYEAYGSIPLKELNIKLLEKVEELTLYTLEQQEEIEALKKQMVEMQTLLEKINVDVKK